ncbi:molybdenum cofactor biosynthesis protein MoaE [Oxalobacter aliiformigenes]|uniref:molybdenum cofactor biosynthesis protein MoaE n=1 Tax=Oxalobacter aliiformigenes TaxID=2946593 RepID=UPI0022AF97B4|nr:molybdenum cofactor biosynthesis protein MoaE [Oxalobacter aliiformigenes]MCZ4064372.1 molybdenum cofactor biosynthesis protein MoaE [Oxalobacter aliiformigenes]WAW00352.1 molybdenum cofactor biosynthesis protein MoaE [Oxalobacter aliiformigenes]
MVTIRVQQQDFDMNEELKRLRAGRHDIGAVVSFLGTVRDIHNEETVLSMELEHYPEMTENVLKDIADEALKRWNILDVTIIHRVGKLKPSDQIVLIAVASGHRGEAFSACEYIIDTLKDRAPFWKKEETPNGVRWVEAE